MHTSSAAPRKLPSSTWAEIRTAHASGIGLRELARNMGIPAGTVLARAKREGWTRRIEAAKSIARQASPAPVAVADAAAATMGERGQRHLQRMAGIVERTLPHVEGMEPGAILDCIEDVDRLDKVARRTYGLEKANPFVNLSIYCGEQPIREIEGRVVEERTALDGE